MRFKKFVSLLVAVCLGAISMISAGAIENTDLKAADVSANKTIDVDDALLTLQYSVAKIRKFPTHDYYNNVDGCIVPEYKTCNSKDGVLAWINSLANQPEVPVMIESANENGGFPILTCNNPEYDKYRFESYLYNWSAEYGEIKYDFSPDTKWGSAGIFFSIVPEDKRVKRDLESEFSSAFSLNYKEVSSLGNLRSGNYNGIEYLCWDKVDRNFYAGCVFRKDHYVVKVGILEKASWSDSIFDMFNLELVPTIQRFKDKPIMQKAGDVNGDGKIDAEDALMILQYAVGKIDDF